MNVCHVHRIFQSKKGKHPTYITQVEGSVLYTGLDCVRKIITA